MSHERCVAILRRLLLRRIFETQRPGRSYAVGVGLRRLECGLELNRSVHRLDQVSRSLAPEDGVGSFVEVVEQVLDLWAGVERVVAVVCQVSVAPIQRP
jgi:hypothetical protein